MCKGDHTLCHCEGFIKLNPIERCEYIKQHNLCYNCLAPGHSAYRCRLKMSCRKCNKRHHTLTHQSTPMTSSNQPGNTKEQDKDIETQQDAAKTNVTLSSHVTATSSTAILATALVPVREHESGRVTVLRALIDHGSQATFMSERAAQMLRLKRTPVNGTITGVGSTKTNVKHTAEIQLLSRHDASFNFTVKTITTRFENCDTLQELLKAIVYCKRFLKGRKMENKDLPVNTEELDDAMKTCLRMTQKDSFEEEIENLKTKRPIKKQSKLNNLKPYLDDDGILRQKLMTDFWHRWQQEYLSRMQQRSKWHHKVKEFEIGHIVLIKADNLPPAKWMMGRIVDKHPGTDGVTHVYSVKSGDSVVQRPFNKLCYLPIDTE
ncbi:hypothetical protein HF086_002261 [Spodoptera exigua]|uniref:DUF5641 domain-containing protein n=1 Tax=Spodoptera exigua TaxID=7107 RepID=A0A922SBU0_SPOEX|nr:hypothetical protein HF086_002261 [Spodoptera exigua]